MSATYDVIVIGLGAMGSAASYHLASRGKRVLGIDRFAPPHNAGSSHGQTRIIREAYFEDPSYVPIIQRSYELWRELEERTKRSLLLTTGGIMIGRPESEIITGAQASATHHHLPHEMLSSSQIRDRFSMFRPEEEMIGMWEPRAGMLFPEACVDSHLQLAIRAGAVLRTGETVLSWKPDGQGVRVKTDQGEYIAGQLLVTAGAWFTELLPGLDLPFHVERQVQFWFEEPFPDLFSPDQCPVHIWEYQPEHFFYGFPDLGQGVKIARHHEGKNTDPNTVDRTVSQAEIDSMLELVERYLPIAVGPVRQTTVCVYTNSPDQHFFIDRHPEHPQVLIASPCSGHGFKFSSALGEVFADLLTTGTSRFDLSLFRWRAWR